MPQSMESFIRKNGLTAAIFNIVLNPFFAWLVNREMADVPLTGDGSALIDTAITCFILSLLVTLFISADTRRALKSGAIESATPPLPGGRLLHSLPGRPWKLGILLGLTVAVVVTPCLTGLFSVLGVTSFSFPAFALLKAVYTPLLAYAVARWVILRQISAAAA